MYCRWCSNKDNGVIITGYTQEGTLAKELLNHPETVKDLQGNYQVTDINHLILYLARVVGLVAAVDYSCAQPLIS